MRYILDTNILIYYFNGYFSSKQKEFIDEVLNNSFNVSCITKIEFLGWNKHTKESYELAIEFLTDANVLHLDDEIINETIYLKRQRNLKIADAIIAATAEVYDAILITRNASDFQEIEKLILLNPFNK